MKTLSTAIPKFTDHIDVKRNKVHDRHEKYTKPTSTYLQTDRGEMALPGVLDRNRPAQMAFSASVLKMIKASW